jgi:DNA topoisomerase-1
MPAAAKPKKTPAAKPAASRPKSRATPAGGGKDLVIVESPAKARTIGKFLGKEFVVQASIGHVRDLPTSSAELPPSLKKSKYGRLGVDLEHDFEPIYVVPAQKRPQIKTLQRLLEGAPALWLATDEDREGEAISWHLLEVLKPRCPVHRLVFHEITEEAIREALRNPRSIDEDLVEAQETRRILDRLFGYELSPVLWRKIRTGLSAGRVQSVALRLLVDRETERLRFRSATWWDVTGTFSAATTAAGASGGDGRRFDALLVEVKDRRVATGRDFDPTTGATKPEAAGTLVLDEAAARALAGRLAGRPGEVLSVEEKPYVQRPAAPFTTSTLQQEAGRKLRFPARRTMGVAQRLYEEGVITYMRTDSTALSSQAIEAARTVVRTQYGPEFLPREPRHYQTKVKNAQEAHEAIRPAGHRFTSPADVRKAHGDEAGDLYDLIWKRTVASQMPDARGQQVAVRLRVEDATFRATGKTVEFAGFQRAYVEDRDDVAPDDEREAVLPALARGQRLDAHAFAPKGHTTQPPARYTEASLVKELDQRGIGRPSTWASIIDVLLQRDYAFKRGTALVPSYTAFAVVRMLTENFGRLLDYEFTARMEDDLDAISRGEAEGREYLRRFYLGNGQPGLKPLVESGIDQVDPRAVCSLPLGEADGRKIEVRVGKFGLFLTDGTTNASIPEDTVPDELTVQRASELLAAAAQGPRKLCDDPATGKPVYVKVGRFGPYVQLGESDAKDGGEKPKMVSLLEGMEPDDVTPETALRLLALPRDLGAHPEDPKEGHVFAMLGRFGPYVKWGEESRSIPRGVSVLEIGLAEAVELLKAPRGRRGRAAAPAALREIGPHPEGGATIRLFKGRYGPYVSDGKVNASLPKGADPMTVSLSDAVDLLRRRAERMKEGGGRGRRGASRGKRPPSDAPPEA